MVDAILALAERLALPVSPLSKTLLGCPSGPLTLASTCTGGVIQNLTAGEREQHLLPQYFSQHQHQRQRDRQTRLPHQRQAHDQRHAVQGELQQHWRRLPHGEYRLGEQRRGIRLDGIRQLDLDGQFPPGERIPGGLQPVCLSTSCPPTVANLPMGITPLMGRPTPSIRASRVTVGFPLSPLAGFGPLPNWGAGAAVPWKQALTRISIFRTMSRT